MTTSSSPHSDTDFHQHDHFLKPIKRIAILVDGGFYRWRAHSLFGEKTPEDRADELFRYCLAHANNKHYIGDVYRIFYYDCTPSTEIVYNPISKKQIHLGKTELFSWQSKFIEQLKQKRKMALRMGKLSIHTPYILSNSKIIKKLSSGAIQWNDLKDSDLTLNIEQKGVDMRIGVDIASLAFKRQVDQIVLISGDSDFVPAAKLARREGIDFIVDPMGADIADDLFEHIDGLQTRFKKFLPKEKTNNQCSLTRDQNEDI
jgi:uncharacterized LabA/DUF88 family protein